MTSYSVKAYKMVNGREELHEWATGFSHFQGKKFFQNLYDTNEFSKLVMKKVENN
jgi:hypothetical protein|tara:strand:+ start:1064 stop:1228 length:165 start_codon:yes stop_codon:yes gene_type:complete